MTFSLMHVSSAPETFGVLDSVVAPPQRRALAEVSRMLLQISTGQKFNAQTDTVLTPLNDFIAKAIPRFSAWLSDSEYISSYKRASSRSG